jgi:hypothetical protein
VIEESQPGSPLALGCLATLDGVLIQYSVGGLMSQQGSVRDPSRVAQEDIATVDIGIGAKQGGGLSALAVIVNADIIERSGQLRLELSTLRSWQRPTWCGSQSVVRACVRLRVGR